MAESLEKLDPQEAWKPAPSDGWNLKWAAHLYRRAALGAPPPSNSAAGSWNLLQQAVRRGREAAVEALLAGGEGQEPFNRLVDEMGQRIAASEDQVEKLQGWWLYRMLYTPHPLLERCTLFWHNHFATSVAKVRSLPLMYGQNQLLRRHAVGSFRTLLEEIGRDPAMLVWLDANSNVKGSANENYAREVMELFSLGVGNYTERDIQEAARALTGSGVRGGRYEFRPDQHDDGPKTILGHTGRFAGDDVARILLEQPSAPRFLARKLFRQFISETDSPPDRLIQPLAYQLAASDYDLRRCLGTILRSRLFYSEHAYRRRVKSPVQYVVGLLRTFDARVSVESLAGSMRDLGQSLFAPPNVKGWDGGRAWINSATLLARHNLAWRLVGGQDRQFKDRLKIDALVQASAGADGVKQVDFLLKLLLQGDVEPGQRQKLIEFVEAEDTKKLNAQQRIRQLTHAILLIPAFQLA